MEALELRFILPRDLRVWWPVIKDGVHICVSRNDCDAIPEEIYSAISSGSAQLFVGLSGGRYQGFVICQKEGDAIFIWLCYSPYREVLERFLPMLKDIALGGGLKKLRFGSSRRGAERLARLIGFKTKTTIFEANANG